MKNGVYKGMFGEFCCYKDGLLHKDNEAAIIYPDGRKEWWRYGKLHREDGPAVEDFDNPEWFLEGIQYTEEEFNHEVKKRKLLPSLESNLEKKPTESKLKI